MKDEKNKTRTGVMSFVTDHKGLYILSIILAVVGVACSMVPYYVVSKLIIGLVSGIKDLWFYMAWCGVAAAFFLGRTVFHIASSALSHLATFRVIAAIRYRMAAKLARTPLGYVLDTPSGRIKNILVEKVDSIEPTLAHVLPEVTSNLLISLSIIGYLFSIDWRMALVSLITFPIGFLCFMGMMSDYKARFQFFIDAQKHVNAASVEYINGIEVIKAFNQSAASYKKFTDAVRDNAYSAIDWIKSVGFYIAAGFAIWPAVLIGVLPVGCLFVMNQTLTVPDFITIMILSLGIIGPLMGALHYSDAMAKTGTIFQEISEVLAEPEMKRPGSRVMLNGTDIQFKNVSFAYGDTPVLNGLELEISANAVTALVGPSGGGKSTIAKLLASLWDVTDGEITVGGRDIRTIPFEQLMDAIAYVAQDNYLFDDTIRNNIRMGNPAATDAEVEEAAKASGCHEFIMALQDGYETVAGGAGGHLSGGERQRVTIARAMLKNAPIIILDEATAYTDPENEAVVQRAVAGLIKGKTLIVIAHRLSTITGADKIVVIEKGKVLDQGTHEELLGRSDLYRSMWISHMEIQEEETRGEALCQKQ